MANDQERLATLEAKSEQHQKAIEDMAFDVKEIKDKLLLRPSWSVTVIITILSTMCASLIVFVATKI